LATMRADIKQFNFQAFEKNVKKFMKTLCDDPYDCMCLMDKPDGYPLDIRELYENAALNIKKMILEEGRNVFLPFSSGNYGDPIACADGKEYEIPEEDDEDEEENNKEKIEDDYYFSFGDIECLGFLMYRENDVLIVRSALLSSGLCMGPGSSVSLVEKCGVFEKPMIDYINKFIKK